eukprot:3161810-Amphidinium_carterae.1
MPAPSAAGSWTGAKLSTAEAAGWLIELLRKRVSDRGDYSGLGTHSLKATLLSWCAKAGVPESSRRLLGKHVKPKDLSVTVYSRDALAKPLRDLGAVLGQVLRGEFTPDRSRSGYFNQQVCEIASQPPEVEGTPTAEPVAEDVSSEGNYERCSESAGSAEDVCAARVGVRRSQ